MKIVIPGGSGQVGTVLARAFARDGHEVTVLSRQFPRNLKHAGMEVYPEEMACFHEVAGPNGEKRLWRTAF